MVLPKSVTFPFSLHLKTAESGTSTSMLLSLARRAELTGNLGGRPQDFFSIHDGQLEIQKISP